MNSSKERQSILNFRQEDFINSNPVSWQNNSVVGTELKYVFNSNIQYFIMPESIQLNIIRQWYYSYIFLQDMEWIINMLHCCVKRNCLHSIWSYSYVQEEESSHTAGFFAFHVFWRRMNIVIIGQLRGIVSKILFLLERKESLLHLTVHYFKLFNIILWIFFWYVPVKIQKNRQ